MRIILLPILLILSIGCLANVKDSMWIQAQLQESIKLQKAFQPKQALKLLTGIKNSAETLFGHSNINTAKIYYNLASCQLDFALYEEAKEHLDLALKIYELSDSVSVELGDTHLLIGIYYDYMAEYDKALLYYAKTKDIYLKLFPLGNPRFGYLYNNIGICYFFKGDVERALNFFNKTLAITIENFGSSNTKISRDITNASLCHTKLNELNLALEKLEYSLKIAKKNEILDSYVAGRIHHALSITYFKFNNFKKASYHAKIAHKLRLKHFHKNHIEVAKGYLVSSDINLKDKNAKEATQNLQKALTIFKKLFKEKHPEIASVYTNLCSITLIENNLPKALQYINQSLYHFEYDENIPVSDNDKYDKQILTALDLKAQIHFKLWETTNNILHLQKSNKIYGDLIFILNQFRQGFKEDTSKEILASEFFHVFEGAIEASYELYYTTDKDQYLKQAFQRCEYSTSFVLLENIRNNQAKNKSSIPDSLLNQEHELRLAIAELEKTKRDIELNPEQDQIQKLEIISQIFDKREKHTQLIEHLESNYHNYHYYKQDLSIVSIEDIQNNILANNQTFLEYFVGEKHLFIFIINKDFFTIEKIEKSFPLESWITGLKEKIILYQYPFNLGNTYHDDLIQYAGDLCYELIYPIEEHLNERLIIVPGGPLAEVPFECFIKQFAPSASLYKKHKYLMHEHAISYCYSGTLLNEMIKNTHPKTSQKTIAFAPSFNNFGKSGNLRDLLLLPLKHNDKEVKEIGKIMNAKTIIGSEATEKYFISSAPDYNILHFATHALADNDNSEFSFLAFSEIKDSTENELLYVKDIYNIPMNAKMVTLSACETGVGKNKKGEGIISLARSFAYSGTGNINTSLWKVNDQKMSTLMKNFYENIATGQEKDIAMRNAKLELIEQQTTNALVHPFYWTAMISIGDTQAIGSPNNQSYWKWMISIFGIFVLSWLALKYKSRSILAN